MDRVHDGGDLTPRFAFMTVLSCGIATLGLLQNSVAVIIGAMLVSPLMGPIVALGFSLTTLDYHQMKRSVTALGAGVLVAVFSGLAGGYAVMKGRGRGQPACAAPARDLAARPLPGLGHRRHPGGRPVAVAVFRGRPRELPDRPARDRGRHHLGAEGLAGA